jgi:hypothetical protein
MKLWQALRREAVWGLARTDRIEFAGAGEQRFKVVE